MLFQLQDLCILFFIPPFFYYVYIYCSMRLAVQGEKEVPTIHIHPKALAFCLRLSSAKNSGREWKREEKEEDRRVCWAPIRIEGIATSFPRKLPGNNKDVPQRSHEQKQLRRGRRRLGVVRRPMGTQHSWHHYFDSPFYFALDCENIMAPEFGIKNDLSFSFLLCFRPLHFSPDVMYMLCSCCMCIANGLWRRSPAPSIGLI